MPSAETMSDKLIACRYIQQRFSMHNILAWVHFARKYSNRFTSPSLDTVGVQCLGYLICRLLAVMNAHRDVSQPDSIQSNLGYGELRKDVLMPVKSWMYDISIMIS